MKKKERFLQNLKNLKRTKFIRPETMEPMAIIEEEIKVLYNKNECYFLAELRRCQRLIIDYTKDQNFSEANEIISISRKILEKLKGEARILGAIYLYPSFSYHASKLNRLSLAKRYITLTIKYDDMLSDKFPILHLHKLHHLQNLATIHIYSNNHIECAKIYIDVFCYISTYALNPKFGNGNKTFFDKMQPHFDVSTVSSSFIPKYFMTVWENPIIEDYIINSERIEEMLSINIEDQNSRALRDMWIIQKIFLLKNPNYNLVSDFFNRYDFYLFDPLRLLILRSLINTLSTAKEETMVIDFIKTKLNFKDTTLIIRKLFNKSKLEV